MVKRCFKCGTEKPLDDFYRHRAMSDGRLNKCKECTKKDVRATYWQDAEASRAKNRERYQDPSRKASLVASTKRRRESDPVGMRRRGVEANQRWGIANAHKRAAHSAVARAIRSGVLQRMPCEVCASDRAAAHHDDYAKPLDVRWFCAAHHAAHHAQMRAAGKWPRVRTRGPQRSESAE